MMNMAIDRLAENLAGVKQRIERAALAVDRDPATVRLVAVTKYVDADVIRRLYKLGCRDFGESRPQALWEKAVELEDLDLRWHMIGHLQTNKVRRTLPCVSLLHSADTIHLLQKVDQESKRLDLVAQVLCEINISGDETKHGFSPDAIESALREIAELSNVRVRGLMAMASRQGGVERAEDDFRRMQELMADLKHFRIAGVELDELSMGMSADFEQAIAHGATIVRVGSVLFQ